MQSYTQLLEARGSGQVLGCKKGGCFDEILRKVLYYHVVFPLVESYKIPDFDSTSFIREINNKLIQPICRAVYENEDYQDLPLSTEEDPTSEEKRIIVQTVKKIEDKQIFLAANHIIAKETCGTKRYLKLGPGLYECVNSGIRVSVKDSKRRSG
ncbi:unnamed protein product [Allacma fusca]|uniref:Uncharacterized protein n=1 Tax=Allacma fusca TaxID=39272 RepID=A0A8J2JRM1_9HEXA|nr:unnamed protein product [Allacma fusca]